MLKTALALFALSAAAFAQSAPATYKSAAELMDVLKANIPKATDQASAPVVTADSWHASVVYRNKPGVAMAHATGPAKGTEVHYIIDGSATVITGGSLLRPAGGPSDIQGGVTHHLAKGDVLVIPAGTPHWYKEIQGSVTYLEVRFDVEKDKK
jgi:oxalate decarboxylase/phosphoglucose isomerase-like protein (cupin superfamily)